MKKILSHWSTICIITTSIFITGCLDEFNPPEIANSETLLVVEGNISDVETNIKLTSTTPLGTDGLLPVDNANIQLESENTGSSNNLIPLGNGQYQLSATLGFNDKYRIRIETESDIYVSEFLELVSTPAIDSVGWEEVDDLFQVHVSTHDDSNQTRYYLWNFEETWLYRSRYTSNYIYGDSSLIPRRRDQRISTCWRTLSSTSILVGTTINLTEDVVFKEPLHRIVPEDNLKLSNTYSILVKQYALTEDAYNFWELLKKNSESLGTFFDPQPSQLPSNITCISNPDRQVIGFISASQEQQERIFVKRSDLPFRNIPFAPSSFCEIDTIENIPAEITDQFSSGINLATNEILDMFTGRITGYESVPRFCADCRVFGGETIEPDFWRN